MGQKKHSSKPSFDYDAIVIGTGPGGEGAAMYLAKSGRRVAAIERYQESFQAPPTPAPIFNIGLGTTRSR